MLKEKRLLQDDVKEVQWIYRNGNKVNPAWDEYGYLKPKQK